MYDEILLPTDGSAHATAAAEHALALARAFDATVHVLGVADVDRAAGLFNAGGVDEAFVERVERDAQQAVDRTASLAADDDRLETVVVDGDPGEAIVDYIEEAGLDAVVMGTHGRRGIRRFIAGSVTEHVIRVAPVPVFTVRRPDDVGEGDESTGATGDLPRYERVLVPTDGSDTAERAVEHALAIAEAFDGELHALNVVDVGAVASSSDIVPSETVIESLTDRGEAAVADVAERAGERGVEATTDVRQDFPGSGILGYVREQEIDIVVMGTHGRTGLGRVLLGSTAERVIRRAEVPVCAVPAEGRKEAMEEEGVPEDSEAGEDED
ncbi:universal stress protein [Haloglomus litoreum]|uniref:universal stress protein n=1 Tax=Haloglomus litoreum TaxID=3034026 RepID=UPI0023E769C1|nr:universal stress protein [Haloglomus sp. DT116]